jgi:hypothetical protein
MAEPALVRRKFLNHPERGVAFPLPPPVFPRRAGRHSARLQGVTARPAWHRQAGPAPRRPAPAPRAHRAHRASRNIEKILESFRYTERNRAIRAKKLRDAKSFRGHAAVNGARFPAKPAYGSNRGRLWPPGEVRNALYPGRPRVAAAAIPDRVHRVAARARAVSTAVSRGRVSRWTCARRSPPWSAASSVTASLGAS